MHFVFEIGLQIGLLYYVLCIVTNKTIFCIVLEYLWLLLLLLLQSLPESPYLLEEIANQVSEESSSEVKLQLLTAVMKMFFRRPPECQEMLGRLLEFVIGTIYYIYF